MRAPQWPSFAPPRGLFLLRRWHTAAGWAALEIGGDDKRITGKSSHAARSHILIDPRLTVGCPLNITAFHIIQPASSMQKDVGQVQPRMVPCM